MEKEDPDSLVPKIRLRMSVSHGYNCQWSWRKCLQENGKIPEVKDVLIALNLSGEGSNKDVDSTILGFGMEDLDSFATMDWMSGDWRNKPHMQYNSISEFQELKRVKIHFIRK